MIGKSKINSTEEPFTTNITALVGVQLVIPHPKLIHIFQTGKVFNVMF